MKIRNPYRNLAHWFRGNTHTHSTLSDGEWPLEKVVAFYRDRGYAFLAMTDHDVFTDLSRFTTAEFLGLSSDEVTVRGRDHIVGLHLKGLVDPFTDHQSTIAAITDHGGLRNSLRRHSRSSCGWQWPSRPLRGSRLWPPSGGKVREVTEEMVKRFNSSQTKYRIDLQTGKLYGGADPRREGTVISLPRSQGKK